MRAPTETFEAQTATGVARMEDAARTRRSMAVSVAIHVLLMVWIMTYKPVAHAESNPIEIEMIEPGSGAPEEAASAPSAQAPGSPASGAPAPSPTEQRFQRQMVRGEVEPVPMVAGALDDRIASRLANLRESGPSPGRVAEPSSAIGSWGAPSNVPSGLGGGGTAQSMTRGGSLGGAPALTLNRGGGSGGPASSIGPARIAGPAKATAAQAPGREDASRTLAGARLLGPVADRPILHVVTPEYPEWAKKEGVEGAVTLHFIVRADGTVKENVLVERTAGFQDFDENAREALRAWRFEPLRGGRTGEQWGTITFHYRLRDAG